MSSRLLGAVTLVAVLALLVAWQLGLLTPEPGEVNLADAVAGQQAAEAQDDDANKGDDETGADSTTTSAATASTADGSARATAPCLYEAPEPIGDTAAGLIDDISQLDGRWIVRESDSTFAGYRIDEILSGADFTAVGRTSGVSGSATVQAGSINAVEIAVDLVGLTSDSRIRDEQLKRQALETTRFPTACFTLNEPISVEALPAEGETLSVDASGSLYIHGVDQPVTLTVESTVSDGLLFVVGSTDVTLADFAIDKPSAPSVADVSDFAVMEFSLVLSR